MSEPTITTTGTGETTWVPAPSPGWSWVPDTPPGTVADPQKCFPNPWISPGAGSPAPPAATIPWVQGETRPLEALPVVARQAEVVLAALLQLLDRGQEIRILRANHAAHPTRVDFEFGDDVTLIDIAQDGDFAATVEALYTLLGTVRGRRFE